ncbi:MAG TPA: hypothetical protein VIC07_03385 [Acidimicrobiia bacterium]|jgi:hypothetical protein
MTFVAVVELIAGAGILAFWAFALTAHKVPEASSGDRAIWFHVTAECVLAMTLVIGGLSLLVAEAEDWARVVAGVAIGGMVYSTINSPGYYAREGTWPVVAGFAGLTLIGLVCAVILATG